MGSTPKQIVWTGEQEAFIEQARGERDFSEFVRTESLRAAAKILKQPVPKSRGRGRPRKNAIDEAK